MRDKRGGWRWGREDERRPSDKNTNIAIKVQQSEQLLQNRYKAQAYCKNIAINILRTWQKKQNSDKFREQAISNFTMKTLVSNNQGNNKVITCQLKC